MAALINNAPAVIGSLTQLIVADGSLNFNVGDIVDVTSSSGVQAKARVSSTSTQSGLIAFTLENGGWGYTANAHVLISDVILNLVNVLRPITYTGPSLQLFLDMTQGTLVLY